MALPPFRFFGGKGGVGKTTCAAAAALRLAETGGRRVLAVSTDPAHSLGDALKADLSAEPIPLPVRKGVLLAAELDVEKALDRWLGERREVLREIASRGTYLDDQDVDRLLGLSLPGADELAGLLELARLARESGADEVVVDTAPTAHTLRLLEMPGLLRRFARVLDALEERHRLLAERFGRGHVPGRADGLIGEIGEEGAELGELLRDPDRAAFSWVLLPEALAVEETRDALATLDEAGISVREVIVNRVARIAPPGGCPACEAKRRAEMEAVAGIRKSFGDRSLRFLPAFGKEPRGLPALRRVGRALASRGEDLVEEPSPAVRRPKIHSRRAPPAWLDEIVPPGVRLVLFGGKGGVGKTTCAAATALSLAGSRPGSVLLLSTDPAHSLADVLETPLGNDERSIAHAPPGLRVRELDSTAAFEGWRARHRGELGEGLGAMAGESGDEVIRQVLEITPPGLDELVSLSTILDAVLEEGGPGVIVVDTAPTGHALRLLEAPELALEWDRALLSILLKYREAVGLGRLAEGLVELSKSLKRLLALLRDPDRARFLAVTRAAELPRLETLRLLDELRRLSVAVPAVIVNTVSECDCPGGRAAKGEVSRLRKGCGGCAIMTAPAVYPPPRGVEALSGWARTWKKE